MPDLEQQLTALGAALDWPSTPDLAGRVAYSRGRRGNRVVPRWALAAAALVIALAALLGYTPSREAIANWVNVHVLFERVHEVPTPSAKPPGPLGERLGLGGRTTLAGAQQQVTWHVAIPASLGRPDEVYLQPPPDAPVQGEVTLVYATRPGIPVAGQTGVSVLITEARGAVDTNFFGKMLGPDTTLETMTLSGHDGYWISGSPNVFFFIDANGEIRNETMRLAANTLILDYGGTVIRIEGNLTKASGPGDRNFPQLARPHAGRWEPSLIGRCKKGEVKCMRALLSVGCAMDLGGWVLGSWFERVVTV